MNPHRIGFISERVKVISPLSSDPLRYNYLNLQNAEPNLGTPLTTSLTAFRDFVLTSNLQGQRQFKSTILYDLTYTSYSTNSSTFLTQPRADLRYFQLTGGRIIGDINVQGNIVATGGVSALSARFITVNVTSFSALSVFSFGYEPALSVGSQGGLFDIATFYDRDNPLDPFVVMTIKDRTAFGSGRGSVGINTRNTPEELTVLGSISASESIFFGTYNTNHMIDLYNTTQNNSGGWESAESTVRTLSTDWASSNIIPIATQYLSASPVTLKNATIISGLSVQGGLSADRLFGVFQNNVIQRFAGDGTRTLWPLSSNVTSANDILVYIGGIYQDKVTYSVITNTNPAQIQFTEAPPLPTDFLIPVIDNFNVEIVFLNANPYPIGQVGDGAVTETKLADRAVTSRKLASNLTLVGNLSVVGTLSAAGYVLTNSTIPYQTFDTDGTTTSFTLLCAVGSKNDINVFVSGVYQNKSNFSLTNPYLLQLDGIPPAGTEVVEVVYLRPFPATTFHPVQNSVINSSIASGAVTLDKTNFTNLSVANTLSAAAINFSAAATAPNNTTTPVFWATATLGGSSFRVPLYR